MTKPEKLIVEILEIDQNGIYRQDAYGNVSYKDSDTIWKAAPKFALVCLKLKKALQFYADTGTGIHSNLYKIDEGLSV